MKSFVFVFIITLLNFSLANASLFDQFNSSLKIEVYKLNGASFICSSVAATPYLLVTAAHCLEGATSILVHMKGGSKKIKSLAFYKHPNYDQQRSNYLSDIGIVLLPQSLPAFLNYLPLLRQLDGDEELFRVGYGGRQGQNKMTIISSIFNFREFSNFAIANRRRNYILMEDQFSYSGDSGGPVFAKKYNKYYLVGIHSTKQGNFSYNQRIDAEVVDWVNHFFE